MLLDVALPLSSLHNVRALAYDVVNDFVYWVDGRTKSIRCARDDGSLVRLPASVYSLCSTLHSAYLSLVH